MLHSQRLVVGTIVVVSMLLWVPLCAQNSGSHGIPLSRVSVGQGIPTNVPNGSLFKPLTCDDNGAIYARVAPLDKANPMFGAPIYRFDPSGNSVKFDFNTMPDSVGKEVGAFTFAVARSGDVHAVVRTLELKKDGVDSEYIVTFSKNGQYKSRFEIDKKYRPTHLVALSNGNFFLTGLFARDGSQGAALPRSFTVLLDSAGKLLRDMKEPGDDTPKQPAVVAATDKIVENRAIQLGNAWEGADGFLYVMRGVAPSRVQVFNPDGTFLKAINLRSPVPEYQSEVLSSTNDKLWVTVFGPPVLDEKGYKKTQPVNLVVYNAESGEPISMVDVSTIRAPGACALNDELLLLKPTPAGKFSLIRGKVGN